MIFVSDIKDEEHLKALIDRLQANSVLKFTYELNIRNKLPFLDVLVTSKHRKFETTVYRKATDIGKCLNVKSECPSRYITNVIRAFIRRAIRNFSSWELPHVEFCRIKQVVNNGYSNAEIDTEIKQHVEREATSSTQTSRPSHLIHLYCKHHMSSAYKTDERAIRDSILHNVSCVDTAYR